MYEQEKQRATHLLILLCYTIFTIVLAGETLLLGWEIGAVILLMLGVLVSWGIHIVGKIPESISIWLYFVQTMLAFFFYGTHESSIYDLAPVMLTIILIYSTTETYTLIRLCVVIYFLTMFYDYIFVLNGSMELTPLSVTRTLLHFALVYMGGRLSKVMVQRRRMERQITDSRIAGLEESNRRTEDFLASVSHELRTPINAVTGISAVMLKNEQDADKRKEIISVQEAGQRLFGQIEDILDYTEIDTGKIRISEDTYMISSVINDIITGNRMLKRENAPELIFDIDARIPSLLIGDARKIKKITKHLLDNAVRFTKKGGVYVRVFALPKPYGVNLCIRISDTGIGIAGEEMGKITEKFYKSAGGRSRRAGGLGLGLPIVNGMVTAMEGFMQIESREKEGTNVFVSIPQKVVDPAHSMVINHRDALCVACFFRFEKCEVPKVREYYNEMITHMVQGFDIPLHRVCNLDELDKLNAGFQVTHLFIGREEYEESRTYFESMNRNTEVIVVADDAFTLPDDSRVRIFRKPFYSFMVERLLNAQTTDVGEVFKERRMICPDVKVLVVDDEPMNLIVAEEIFKEYQMNVKTAQSGAKAIELCEKEDFDLIFLDHMMPEMDGVETLKRLRKIHTESGRAHTIIALTANAVSGAREMFLREGFDEFISKPIEYSEMEHVLRKVLPQSAFSFVEDGVSKLSEKKPEEDMIDRLEKAGINTASGLKYCRNDEAFYRELLTMFVQDAARKETQISEFYKQDDFENYRILVHALKSTAKMIGADELSELAKLAEEAAKRSDLDYIREHQEELLAKYRDVSLQIMKTIDKSTASEKEADGKGSLEVSREEVLRQLEELENSLKTYEIDKAESLLSEMEKVMYQGKALGEMLGEIRQQVGDFEFGTAAELAEALINTLKGGEAG